MKRFQGFEQTPRSDPFYSAKVATRARERDCVRAGTFIPASRQSTFLGPDDDKY